MMSKVNTILQEVEIKTDLEYILIKRGGSRRGSPVTKIAKVDKRLHGEGAVLAWIEEKFGSKRFTNSSRLIPESDIIGEWDDYPTKSQVAQARAKYLKVSK